MTVVEWVKLATWWQNTVLSKSFPQNSTEEESEEEAPPPKKTPAKATPAKSKKAPAKAEESDDEEDDEDGKITFDTLFAAGSWYVCYCRFHLHRKTLSPDQKSLKKRLHHPRKQPNLQLSLLRRQLQRQLQSQ